VLAAGVKQRFRARRKPQPLAVDALEVVDVQSLEQGNAPSQAFRVGQTTARSRAASSIRATSTAAA
jgi:hypothetical protein